MLEADLVNKQETTLSFWKILIWTFDLYVC